MNLLKKIQRYRIVKICLSVIILVIIAGFLVPYIAPNNPDKINMGLKYASATMQFPFGNDYLGRCILSRILYGIKPSVIYVIMTMSVTVGIGLIVGVLSGYYQGKVDEFFMRICDVFLSFPPEAMVLAAVGILGVGLKNMLFTIILLRWPWYARIIRSAVLKYRNKNHIYYSKAIGQSDLKIIIFGILPSIVPDVAVVASNNVCTLILMMSGFSFLGLGVRPPQAEWGMMLSEAKKVMLTHPEQLLAPSGAIVLVCICFAFLGDALRDASDSKAKGGCNDE